MLLTGTLFWLSCSVAVAGDVDASVTIKDHRFDPPELIVPRDARIKLTVRNNDPTPEEFESYELNREKVIPGNTETVIYLGPLSEGEYPFFGDFHQDSAQGRVIAK